MPGTYSAAKRDSGDDSCGSIGASLVNTATEADPETAPARGKLPPARGRCGRLRATPYPNDRESTK